MGQPTLGACFMQIQFLQMMFAHISCGSPDTDIVFNSNSVMFSIFLPRVFASWAKIFGMLIKYPPGFCFQFISDWRVSLTSHVRPGQHFIND